MAAALPSSLLAVAPVQHSSPSHVPFVLLSLHLLSDYRFKGRTTAPANDINCGQKDSDGKPIPFCKICDGVAAVADACDNNPKYVALLKHLHTLYCQMPCAGEVSTSAGTCTKAV
jgi:hypothetical protein